MVRHESSKGFTLLELLIVIAVIAVLSAVTVIVLNPAEQLRKARDARRRTDLGMLERVVERYILDYGQSPPLNNPGGWCTEINNPCHPDVKDALSIYIAPMPRDPSFAGTAQDYFYRKDSSAGYTLAAELENSDENSFCEGGCNDAPVCANTVNTCFDYVIQVVR